MARKLTVEVVGDASGLQRTFRDVGRSTKSFNSDISKASRGALAGSGAFRSFGRSIAFASGGFLAFASVGQFLRKSVDAAKEAEVTQKQLAAQFRASGKDLGSYQDQIDKTANRLSLLAGFENDQVKASFLTIFRTTGNVSKALRDTATAADLARAKHLGLGQAALIVAKTEAGNTTLLRRQGFEIAKNAKAEAALAKLRQIVSGQAAAGTTEQERFGAVLHETEEIVGNGLLPTLNQYLARGSVWLSNMNQSGELQRKVNTAVKTGKEILGAFAGALKTASDAVGGFKHLVELLIGLKLGAVFLRWAQSAKILKDALLALNLASVGASLAGTGTAAATAGGPLVRLLGYLRQIGRIGVLTIGFRFPGLTSKVLSALAFLGGGAGLAAAAAVGGTLASSGSAPNVPQITGGVREQLTRLGSTGQIPSAVLVAAAKAVGLNPNAPAGKAFANQKFVELVFQWAIQHGLITAGRSAGGASADALAKAAHGLALVANPSGATDDPSKRGLNLTAAQRNTFFDNAIARILLRGGLGTISQQIAALHRADALIAARIKITKDVTRRLKLEDELLQNAATIHDLQAQQAADALQARQEARQRALDAMQRRIAAVTSHQFRQLGLSATGDQITPGVANLKKRLATISADVAGSFLDTKKLRDQLARFRKVLGEAFVPKDVRQKIRDMLDEIRQELNNGATNLTKFRHVNTSAILAGLGLSPEQSRALAARLSVLGPGGTVPPSTSAAFAGGRPVVVEHTTYLDGKPIARNTTKYQQKNDRRRAASRRGQYAGRN